MNEIIQLLTFFLLLISCDKENVYTPDMGLTPDEYIHAVDISSYPEISVSNPIFYDLHGNAGSFLSILKENAVNTIRLRLWVNPAHGHSGFDQVKQFSEQLKSMGFKIWLTLHYSDTWADPSQQIPPQAWQGIDFSTLKTNVYHYTQKVTQEIQPNYLQIGNELNTGFLHPYGHITHNFSQFIALMETGIAAVRENTNNTSIIIHYAGFENANWFYDQVSNLDYDIIGLSYYPKWHGKSIHKLSMELQSLGSTHQKKVLIAETAYPFTLDWND